nr:phage holin family protein [Microbacterium ulmi]
MPATPTERDVTTPRGFKDRADDSLFTLVGEVPELVRNLVVAEVDAGKAWLRRTSKDAGIGAGWIVAALFFLFWTVAALLAFAIIGLSSWWPAWVASLVVLVLMLLATALLALLGVLRFRSITKSENPAQSIATDVKEIRDEL